MVKHWKPKNVTSKVFNVANFKYLEDNIVVDNQKTTDELQDSIIADIVASANTLSSQVATNTTLQSTVGTIVTDNIARDVDITDAKGDIVSLQNAQSTADSQRTIDGSDIETLQDQCQEMSFVQTSGTKTKFSGNVKVTGTLELNDNLNDVTMTELSYLEGVTSSIQTQLDSKVSVIPEPDLSAQNDRLDLVEAVNGFQDTAISSIQTVNATQTTDISTNVSDIATNVTNIALKEDITANDTKLALKEDITANDTKLALKSDITYVDAQISNLVDASPATLNTLNELAAALGDDPNYATTVSAQIGLKAPLANPTFTGTVAGITKGMVGLTNVDNTTDAAKPVSTAGQTALNLKANIASPTFTGTVGGITGNGRIN